jgi:hypothetical protein
LLLNRERGAGGGVVSKEGVAVGIKEKRERWGMGVDQPECGAGQPRKKVEYEHRRKKTAKRSIVGM